MRIWPWCVLADAKAAQQGAQIAKVAAESARDKAGNLWQEAHQALKETDERLAAADYRIKRTDGESWPDYKLRLGKILWESRQSAIVLAILDRLDGKTREGYTLWLVESDPAKAEIIRHRASAVADFRSELVAALYAKSPAERRQESLRRGQDHARIYLDNQQSNALSQGRS